MTNSHFSQHTEGKPHQRETPKRRSGEITVRVSYRGKNAKQICLQKEEGMNTRNLCLQITNKYIECRLIGREPHLQKTQTQRSRRGELTQPRTVTVTLPSLHHIHTLSLSFSFGLSHSPQQNNTPSHLHTVIPIRTNHK